MLVEHLPHILERLNQPERFADNLEFLVAHFALNGLELFTEAIVLFVHDPSFQAVLMDKAHGACAVARVDQLALRVSFVANPTLYFVFHLFLI